jgi:hypothetical protein
MNLNNTEFITLTNNGYVGYTLNCLESLKKIKNQLNIHIYCVGKTSFDLFNRKGYKTSLIDDNEKLRTFQEFNNSNWSGMMFYKVEAIYKSLLNNNFVCYTDGDIVFENKVFMDYLHQNISDHDILFQDEFFENDICAGFMFIKSNENTLRIFNPENVLQHKKENSDSSKIPYGVCWNDQYYLNQLKNSNQINYKKLPLDLFPNGRYYYYNHVHSPYLIHFNWVIGNEKIDKMKYYNKWYKDNIDNKVYKLSEWKKIYKNPQNLIVQASVLDGTDSWQPFSVGMCWNYLTCDVNSEKLQIGNHENTVLCVMNEYTDMTRRRHNQVNRLKILQNLNINSIYNNHFSGSEYFERLPSYKFVISPEGNGIDCHRHYEALIAGCIPIMEKNPLIEDKYKNLPILYTVDYSEITEEYLLSKYDEMKDNTYDFSTLFLDFYSDDYINKIKECSNYWCQKNANKNFY